MGLPLICTVYAPMCWVMPPASPETTLVCPISAKTRQGIDELLEMGILTAEVQELKANPNRRAKGTVIEARLDKTRGPLATRSLARPP